MAQALTDARLLLPPVEPVKSGSARAAASAQTTTLVIENMHCGGCLKKVETALSAVPGVTHARANLSTHRALATHGGSGIDVPALITALEQAGFKAAELAGGGESTSLAAADRDYLRRLAVAGFAAANVMLLSVSVWSGGGGDMSPALQGLFHWLSALIALPAAAYAGQPFFRSAYAALSVRRVNMDVPISLGVSLAMGMSVYQTIRGSEQVYFDAAITLLFFLLIGRTLDARMRARAAGAAANLLGLRAQFASVVFPDGSTARVSARDIVPGMKILAAAGERLAADGRIVAGESEIDESLITGETLPRPVKVGDTVHAGTLNIGRSLSIEATAADEGTLIAEIARLMSAAEQGRASYVRLADRAARLYAPAVHALGFSTFVGWMVAGQGWEAALTAAIAVLIITCPCALALAVPAVQVAATSRLFRKGVLVKAPDALERLAEIDAVVLDKTGTLTRGEPMLASSASVDDTVLLRAAALAAVSRHPYARAVVRTAQGRGLAVTPAADVSEIAGAGSAHGTGIDERRLGSADWCGVEAREGVSLWFRDGGKPPVALPLLDEPRKDAQAVVAALRGAGITVELVSGDQPREVARIASAVGIDTVAAGVKPAEKVGRIAAIAKTGRKPLMIGDGLNDAPALAAGHASMSPSSAVDISQTAADVIFQGEALAPVLETIAVARASRHMALQNFAIALGYNAVFVPMAVVGWVTPLVAAVAMSASSIAVTANALRLERMSLSLGSWRSSR